jgi:hypothetical protein
MPRRLGLHLVLLLAIDHGLAQAQPADPQHAEFPHTANIRGRVVDEQGNPVAGARVMLSGIKGNVPPVDSYTEVLKSYSTQTNERGEFRLPVRFTGDQPLRLNRIWVDARGYARVQDTRERQFQPGEESSIEYVIQPGEVLAGRVHPLVGGLKSAVFYRNSERLEVLQIKGQGFSQTVLTDPTGRFELYVPAGEYTIALANEDVRIEARSGSEDLVLIGQLISEPAAKLVEAFSALWSDMDRHYSYFVHKPNVDWHRLREEFLPRIEACGSREELALELVRMLERLEDMHVWLEVDGQTLATYQRSWRRNWNLEAVGRRLAESKTIGQFAQVGTTQEGGYGYLAVFRLQAQQDEVDEVLKELEKRRELPGFLLDLRICSGGSEPIARQIAQWFSPREAVYAMHAYRDGPQHDDFGPRRQRTLSASASAYPRPVVCLTGSRTMSSAEAFVLMMKTMPQVVTVGAATRGASGNPQPFELPGLNFKVWYSRWVAMDAAGNVFEGRGIAPDFVADGAANKHLREDPTFERAIETLRARLTTTDGSSSDPTPGPR